MSQSHYDCPCMEKCPLHHAMSLIGGKWKVQILCAVHNAESIRYNALRGKLDGISNTVLASALRELERDGLVTRREYLEVPVRVEYSPTEDCRELLPILEQLSDWRKSGCRGKRKDRPALCAERPVLFVYVHGNVVRTVLFELA